MVNDFGTVINPMLTAGQAHGRCVLGIDQALMETRGTTTRRAADHRLLHGLRLAAGSSSVENDSVPCKTNRLGVKGCGEAGCAGAVPSVMNAVVDALGSRRITHIDMPVTPEKIWRRRARGALLVRLFDGGW